MHAQAQGIFEHASTQKLLQLDSWRCVRKGVAWHSQQDSAESHAAGQKNLSKNRGFGRSSGGQDLVLLQASLGDLRLQAIQQVAVSSFLVKSPVSQSQVANAPIG